MTERLRAAYGEGPLHLVGHLAFFALTAYVVAQLLDAQAAFTILLWVVAAALIHDLVLLPAYAVADRASRRALPLRAINHVRFVVVVSGALFLAWFPVLLGKSDDTIARNAGLEADGYLGRWLAITAGLAVLSALAYVVRSRRVEQLDHPVDLAADEHAPRA
jgi:hypothetical protein